MEVDISNDCCQVDVSNEQIYSHAICFLTLFLVLLFEGSIFAHYKEMILSALISDSLNMIKMGRGLE